MIEVSNEDLARQIDELRRRIGVLELEIQRRPQPRQTAQQHRQDEAAARQSELDREIEDGLYEAFEFTPDLGYAQTPDTILAALESVGVVIRDTPLMQKRAVARVLNERFPEVERVRGSNTSIYRGMRLLSSTVKPAKQVAPARALPAPAPISTPVPTLPSPAPASLPPPAVRPGPLPAVLRPVSVAPPPPLPKEGDPDY